MTSDQVLPERQSPLAVFLRGLVGNRGFVLGAGLFLVVLLLAVFADQIAPYGPNANNFRARLQPPSAEHWFGTDHSARTSSRVRSMAGAFRCSSACQSSYSPASSAR